ncbi:MAG: hypothetical protein WKF48_09805 [Solirubrobacteraceae bacterium]
MRHAARNAATALGTVGAALALRRAWQSPTAWVARMTGTSISAPDAAGWVTDFLNAAYFARQPELRELEDLRVALAILTTRWQRLGHRRLHAPDVAAFHRAFGRERFLDARSTPRGTLDAEQLHAGARRLIGAWFSEAYADDDRRAHGIAFQSPSERDAYRPEQRLRHARLGDPTPPERPTGEQVWHTYEPVAIASAAAVGQLLSQPARWPDLATDLGRFTAVRSGGLAGQTFEIEVITALTPRTPAIVRGYVTVTTLLSRAEEPERLDAYVADLNDRMVRVGRDQPPPVPDGATATLAMDLTTHEGHFMGRGLNRLLVYEHDGQAFLRAAGTWDDMPMALEGAYRSAGRQAQAAFWGSGRAESSMLQQIARQTAR